MLGDTWRNKLGDTADLGLDHHKKMNIHFIHLVIHLYNEYIERFYLYYIVVYEMCDIIMSKKTNVHTLF